MRRIVLGFMSTVSAVVLLFTYHTSTNSGSAPVAAALSTRDPSSPDPSATATASADTGSATTGSTESSAGATTSSDPAPSSGSGGSSSGTYTGEEADTRWGVVQVRITVRDGKITRSDAVEYPTQNGRDQEINAYAVPALNAEVVQSQSAGIDAVSGATVTSDGYIQSLQSAIDQANL